MLNYVLILVTFIFIGCILMSAAFVPCLNEKSKMYLTTACRSVMSSAAVVPEKNYVIGFAFFMPWLAFTFISMALIFEILKMVMKD